MYSKDDLYAIVSPASMIDPSLWAAFPIQTMSGSQAFVRYLQIIHDRYGNLFSTCVMKLNLDSAYVLAVGFMAALSLIYGAYLHVS